MSAIRLFQGDNHNVLELRALTDEVTGSLILDATVQVTIHDAEGDEVAGETWPKAMALTTESPSTGKYRATLDSALAITSNNEFKATVTAVSGSGIEAEWICDVLPAVRGVDD